VSGETPAILRPGAVTAEQITAVMGVPLDQPSAIAPRVSGSLPSHYAPQARVEIVSADQLGPRANQLAAEGKQVAVLCHERPSLSDGIVVLTLPDTHDEMAQSLYSILRRVDELGCDVTLTTLPVETGLGAAIADRLRRAAGPRNNDKR
ncbi:MAG TPA: Sua5 family C-terminal domain-containing protein, partial [Pirellulaceae bacterium]|nr:Sua5 family C-terminal domain-containing protein [Pirellulaceae bacterium]